VRGNESVEWLNGILSRLWPQINPDIFVPIIDLLEDVMQNSIPSIVSQVKIVNIGQGSTPIRVLSVRWLDDETNSNADDTECGATDRLNEQEQEGEWASLEVSFSYRGQPSSASPSSKAKNANLLVHFFMGMNGVFGTPFRTCGRSLYIPVIANGAHISCVG
jgi:Ca2+-dependent lipid-binding protein